MAKLSTSEQMLGTLQSPNRPCIYLIFGNEPFIKDQTIRAIKRFYQKLGFSDQRSYNGDNLNWSEIENSLFTYGLFSNQILVSIDLSEKTPKEFTNNVTRLCEVANEDTILIIHGNHLSQTQEKAKWFSELALNPKSAYLAFYPPMPSQLPNWYGNEAKRLNILLDPDAQKYLAICFEGNLAAGYQVLYNLYLQGIAGNVNIETIKQQTIAENHFVTFDLTEALLARNSTKALRIIKNLREENEDLKPILWVIHRDLCIILELKQSNYNNLYHESEIFKKYGITIGFKQQPYKTVANNKTVPELNALIDLFTKIDRAVVNETQGWQLLETFVVGFNYPTVIKS